jgi:hypothetical protein
MPWDPPQSTGNVVAIHAAIMPAYPVLENSHPGDGQILLMGGDNHVKQNNDGTHHDYNHAALLNCRYPDRPLKHVDCPNWDLFCCGHAMRQDGHLVIAGGTEKFDHSLQEEELHYKHFTAHNHAAVFDGSKFIPLPDMVPEPNTNPPKGGGHWYPTLITLKTGEVYAFGGHPMKDDTRHTNNTPETLSLGDQPSWRAHPDLGYSHVGEPHSYPRMHLLGNGHIFISSQVPFEYGNLNNHKNLIVDPETGAVNQVTDLPDTSYHSFQCPSVMLPLLSAEGYKTRILLCGGASSQIFDFTRKESGWQMVTRDQTTPRINAMATLLPTGQVLLTGGAAGEGRDLNQQNTGQRPELYTPSIDKGIQTYQLGGVGSWETLNDPAEKLRNYHSTALLMPDGRVWTAGGNGPNQPDGPPDTTVQQTMEIFTPPYASGERPT